MRSRYILAALVCGLVGARVHAGDERNPDVEACAGKNAGDACQRTVVGKPADGPVERKKVPGVCATDRCCELDYSKGSPPETVCSDCLACKPGPGQEPPGPAAEADSPEPAPADPNAPANAAEAPPPNGPGKRGGCSTGGERSPPTAFAMLILAATWRRRISSDPSRAVRSPRAPR